MKSARQPTITIQPLILNRWSPRAMSGEMISDDELLPLFEAARWAPSSYNNQPWRFIYAHRDTKHWRNFLSLLVVQNKVWARDAAVLIILVSYKKFEYNKKSSRTHSFDTGAAWENLALEGTSHGLVVHAMEGFDYKKARTLAKIPKDYDVEAMIAVGKHGRKTDLPEKLQAQEAPNDRKPLNKIISEGTFR